MLDHQIKAMSHVLRVEMLAHDSCLINKTFSDKPF